jgi:hypothetical protein
MRQPGCVPLIAASWLAAACLSSTVLPAGPAWAGVRPFSHSSLEAREFPGAPADVRSSAGASSVPLFDVAALAGPVLAGGFVPTPAFSLASPTGGASDAAGNLSGLRPRDAVMPLHGVSIVCLFAACSSAPGANPALLRALDSSTAQPGEALSLVTPARTAPRFVPEPHAFVQFALGTVLVAAARRRR